MRALQYFGPKQLAFVELPEPEITETEVLLQVKKVGICGTDLHIYNGGMAIPTPVTLGHEFVGDVVKVGAKVTHVAVGDRAVAEHVIGCETCYYCRQGKRNLCVTPTIIGIHKSGALSEYIAIPGNLTYKLPDELNYDAGVLIEPLSIAVYAVRKVGIRVGSPVAVVGQGPIGLFVDQVAKADGGIVFGFDVIDSRLTYAKNHQYVSASINNKNADYLHEFQTLSGSDGADVVFECVGIEPTARLALELARPGGSVIILGVYEHDVSVNMMQVVKKELQVEGSWTCIFSFEPTIQLLKSGQIKTDGLITHRYPFDQAIKAFEDSAQYTDNRIKSVIEF